MQTPTPTPGPTLSSAPGLTPAPVPGSTPVPVADVPDSGRSPVPVPTASDSGRSPAPVPTASDSGRSPAPVPTASDTGRRVAVIRSESTAEIPVHLLFRDDTGPSPVVPAVADPAPRTVARPPKQAGARTPVAAPARPATPVDPRISERPGPVVPGGTAVAAGILALAGCAVVTWWTGVLPRSLTALLRLPAYPYNGIRLEEWGLLALGVSVAVLAFGGLDRGHVGYAWVLSLFGDYRGSVRRTGLVWMSPLMLRRRVDLRLRHWRSEPMGAVDARGTALQVVVLVVWRVKDTARATLAVADHETYLREQVEAAMARVLSQLPADAFHEDAPTLRNAEAVGDALTCMLKAETEPVGIELYSAQPTRIEYAPEVAAAMRRQRVAAIDAQHRDSVLTSVVDAVDDTVHRLTSRGLVELDAYERKALVKDLTVAFYTGRGSGEGV
ncbi:SPFH domain-containing protein [Streptomyces sp. NPDC048416]|uniref:SPFH domain-containing protein n=1 Tax=Streptomyces sp. NPDC048416 TaxID=3365546 RepID=UPI003715F237